MEIKKNRPKSTQRTLPFNTIFEDGVCEIKKGNYSKCIEFADMNYQIARPDDKLAIFQKYCDFLNYYDSTIDVELTFVNRHIDIEEFEKQILLASDESDDAALNQYREEYNQMLHQQIKQGKNSIQRSKYLTFGVKADTADAARQLLNRIETDIHNNFKALGCVAFTMDGTERLKVLHSIYRQDGQQYDFNFDYGLIAKTGLTTKDFVAPASFDFKESKTFRMGETYGQVSFMMIQAPELSDEFLSDIIDLNCNLVISMHIKSIKQNEAMKSVKMKIAKLEYNKIEEQKKAVKAGYDMNILPSDLVENITQAKKMLDDLQSRNERMFMVTFAIMNTADSMEKLKNDVFQVKAIAQQYNCDLQPLEEQQEDGLSTVVPVGTNRIDIQRGLTTSSTAVFIPFTTQEVLQSNGMYYGLNALSHNLIMFNRKNLKNPSGLILGTPGSGKSFAAKREMVNVFLNTKDDILVIDPEREFAPLAWALGGEVIQISAASKNHINPMDMSANYSEDDDPITLKSDFILSLCELLVGGRNGLSAIEKSVIDRCVSLTYAPYIRDIKKNVIPTLKEFHAKLREQPEQEAQTLAVSLELYVSGSLGVFAEQTNVDIKRRFVVFDIKDLGKQLKTMGMLIVLDQIWNRVTENRALKKYTWLFIDEAHLFLKNEYSANFFVEIYKRFRKWQGVPTAITQNVKDFLDSKDIENIFENSDFIMMLNQAPGDRKILAEKLNISQQQLSYVTNSGEGQGLLFCGNAIVPFIDKFPKNTGLYRCMTTKPNEVMNLDELKQQAEAGKVG